MKQANDFIKQLTQAEPVKNGVILLASMIYFQFLVLITDLL